MIPFFKYHGTGNDFILIDNRTQMLQRTDNELFKALCHRHFGIGADGLMLLEDSNEWDFEMFYVNSDGSPSSMCGNGGRCIVALANRLGLCGHETHFKAIDGVHTAKISENGNVLLKMHFEGLIHRQEDYYILNTGSPHLVILKKDISSINVSEKGRSIRNLPKFEKEGINVNFLETISNNVGKIRTYERGVEDETLSCGTGVTAAAILMASLQEETGSLEKTIHASGGILTVSFHRSKEGGITELYLQGSTCLVFEGIWNKNRIS